MWIACTLTKCINVFKFEMKKSMCQCWEGCVMAVDYSTSVNNWVMIRIVVNVSYPVPVVWRWSKAADKHDTTSNYWLCSLYWDSLSCTQQLALYVSARPPMIVNSPFTTTLYTHQTGTIVYTADVLDLDGTDVITVTMGTISPATSPNPFTFDSGKSC